MCNVARPILEEKIFVLFVNFKKLFAALQTFDSYITRFTTSRVDFLIKHFKNMWNFIVQKVWNFTKYEIVQKFHKRFSPSLCITS